MTTSGTATEPRVVVVADPDAGADAAATHIAEVLAEAVEARGRAHWATTGGSTPVGIYRRLRVPPLTEAIAWQNVHVWWGDDRFVPPDHRDSNVKPLDDILLGAFYGEEGMAGGRRPGVPLPFANVHRFPTSEAIGNGHDAAWCAQALAAELLRAGLDEADGWPVFDLMLLGVGSDGHMLSVFPGSDAFDSRQVAMAIPAPTHIGPHIERVTLHPALVDVARDVLVAAYGSDKAPVVADILGPQRDPRRWPAQLARRAGATWILDTAAAAGLARVSPS